MYSRLDKNVKIKTAHVATMYIIFFYNICLVLFTTSGILRYPCSNLTLWEYFVQPRIRSKLFACDVLHCNQLNLPRGELWGSWKGQTLIVAMDDHNLVKVCMKIITLSNCQCIFILHKWEMYDYKMFVLSLHTPIWSTAKVFSSLKLLEK